MRIRQTVILRGSLAPKSLGEGQFEAKSPAEIWSIRYNSEEYKVSQSYKKTSTKWTKEGCVYGYFKWVTIWGTLRLRKTFGAFNTHPFTSLNQLDSLGLIIENLQGQFEIKHRLSHRLSQFDFSTLLKNSPQLSLSLTPSFLLHIWFHLQLRKNKQAAFNYVSIM